MDDDDLVGTVSPIKPKGKSYPRHYPTDDSRRDVVAWVAAGIPHRAMSRLLRIEETTLRKHYKAELEDGSDMANAQIAGGLFQQAMAGNVASLIFWCKTRLRWRETGSYSADDPLVIQSKDSTPVDVKELARELRDALVEAKRHMPPPITHEADGHRLQ